MLFSPVALNEHIKNEFAKKQRSEKRTSYWVTDDYNLIVGTMHMDKEQQKKRIIESGKIPIASYNQTDFEKERIAIEVQF